MKKQLLVTGILGMMALCNNVQAQAWSENFNNGLPAGWTLINNDNLTPNSGVAYVNNAWVSRIKTNEKGNPIAGDSVMVSTSWYNPVGIADDWLITPAFNVSNASFIIKWEERAFDQTFADGYEVLVSTTGTAITDFTTTVLSVPAASAPVSATKYASLSSFVGQNIHVAFRNNSNNKFLLSIDNVAVLVPHANDISLTAVTPKAGSPTDYATINTPISLGGTVFNNSVTTVLSYKVHYQQGGGPVTTDVINGVNILPYNSFDFTCPTAYAMPGSLGDYSVNMWVELTGDEDISNDSNETAVTAVSFMPAKKLMVEEGTGTWCGWCPRGSVYMDSLFNHYGSSFSLVAVHNNDPMVLSSYDAFMGGKIGGYPSVLVDRREEKDPSDLIDVYNSEKDYFGFADITLTDMNATGFDFSVKATVKPALDLSGDYRLVLIITEDKVHGTGNKWPQTNYYSFSVNNLPLTGAGHDWQSEPSPVPDTKMYYDFVARHIVPSVDGAAGSLPASMTAGTSYDYTFTTMINPGYKRDKMHAVVALIRNSDGTVLNSNTITVPVGVADVASGIDHISLYPNPAVHTATISLSLSEGTDVAVQVTDAMGRTVHTIASQYRSAGNHNMTIVTDGLATGLYNVRIQTGKGAVTKPLSVVK